MSYSLAWCDLGIPTVTADDEEGLARGQGAATARSRGWQLLTESWRVAASTASHLGPSHSLLDSLVNRLDLEGMATDCLARAPRESRAFAAAYADGVNTPLPSALRDDPVLTSPDVLRALNLRDGRERSLAAPIWKPWTPVAVMLLAHVLFGAYPETLWREHVRRCLGEPAVNLLQADPLTSAGSNAWLVPGELLDDGIARLHADPHRLLEWPGPYQQMRLRAPGIRVDGLAFPGFPGVPHYGQTDEVAWVVTHAMADSQPLERCGSKPSRHPVVATDVDGPLALAWSASRTGDGGLSTSRSLLRARSCADVRRAFDAWVDPVDDVLTADTHGHASSFVAGRVPELRASQRLLACPSPGRLDGDGPWEVLPVRHDGAHTVLVNANEAKDAEPRLGATYCPPARAHRIRHLLDELTRDGPARPEDAAAVALDTYDAESHAMVRSLLAGTAAGNSRAGASVRARLLAWNGSFDPHDRDAHLVASFRSALVHRLAEQPALVPLFAPTGLDALYAPWTNPMARIGLASWRILRHGEQLGIDTALVTAAALADLASAPPPDVPWCDVHLAQPLATLPDALDGAVHLVPRAVPVGGDTECVLSTGSIPGVSATCLRAPVARVVFAVGHPEHSRWVVPWGASGHVDEPNAHDQSAAWRTGRTLPVRAPAHHHCLPSDEESPHA